MESGIANAENNGELPNEINTRLKDGIGIPHIMVQVKEPQKSSLKEALETKILPQIQEV